MGCREVCADGFAFYTNSCKLSAYGQVGLGWGEAEMANRRCTIASFLSLAHCILLSVREGGYILKPAHRPRTDRLANNPLGRGGREREVRRPRHWTRALLHLQRSEAKCNFPLRAHGALPKPTGPSDSTNTPSINSSMSGNATGTGRNSSPGKVCTQGMSRPI